MASAGGLGEQCGSPGLFSSGSEALGHAAQHQQRGREEAGLGVGGQQPDGEGGASHQEEGGDQDPFAPEAVAVAGEEESAERAGDESDGVGAEAGEDADGR
jgi:hypothetical protein